jgi:ubiquinone/menaquinone biosynthesis C-methylase UbiE
METKIISFWNKDAKGYNKRNMSRYLGQRKIWASIFSESLDKGPLDVLDVGTGPGVVAFILAEMGHRVTGIDLSKEMLQYAQNNADLLNLNVTFKLGDAEKLPFEDESFDAVVNRHVLWTLPQPERAISEWFRVLRPGGKVVIIDGNWYLSRDSSVITRLWGKLAWPLISADDKKWLNEFETDAKKKLPLAYVKRPDKDIEFLKECGFNEILTKPILRRKTSSLLEFIKNGYWGDAFLVQGIK